MRNRLSLHAMTLFLGLLNASFSLGQGAGPLVLEKEIALPGVEGRIDHFSVDIPNQRLFVAALENGSVEILDIRRGKRTAEIKGLEEPQGVYYDFKTGRLYVATGGDGKLRIYDEKSLTLQKTLEFGGDAANVRYDKQTGNIWVGYGNGGIAIANAAGQNVGSVALDTHPESFQFEPNGDRVYVNVPRQFGITMLIGKKRAVVAKWGIGGHFMIPSGDWSTSSAEKGAVEVFRQHNQDHYDPVRRIITAPGARTGLYVPSFNRLFVAVPHRGLQSARVLVYEVKGD